MLSVDYQRVEGCYEWRVPSLFFFFFLMYLFFGFAEIEKIQKGETKKEPEKETYLDLFATKNLKLKERVLIPTKQYPKVSMSRWSYTVSLTSGPLTYTGDFTQSW